ncbi:unnamed protein product [Dicrocoelium dendriticum]|nr:unnamed protein product [Dicrocoelium dendriticum]
MRGISSSSSIYRLNAALNLITFACCRGYCLYRVTYGIYVESDKLSTFYLTILCISMLIMNLINPMLFWILLRNDFLRVPTSSTRVSHTTSGKVQRAVFPPSSMGRSGGSVTFEQLHDKSAGNGMVLSEVGFT